LAVIPRDAHAQVAQMVAQVGDERKLGRIAAADAVGIDGAYVAFGRGEKHELKIDIFIYSHLIS